MKSNISIVVLILLFITTHSEASISHGQQTLTAGKIILSGTPFTTVATNNIVTPSTTSIPTTMAADNNSKKVSHDTAAMVMGWVTGTFMSTATATPIIASMESGIAGKVPLTRTLTIAGTAYDMSSNRTWSPTTTDIPEGVNQYYTNARARASVSITNTGTSGAATYNSSTGVLNVPIYTNSGGTVTSVGISSSTLNISGSPVTTSGNITVNTPTVTFNPAPNRILSTTGSNNTFTISATRNARVVYVVNIAVALTLLPPLTSNAVISLDYSTDAGSNWTNVCRATQSYGVALTLTTASDYILQGEIPANALVRVYRSSNTNTTITLTSVQQEVIY